MNNNGMVSAIGNTPLIELPTLSKLSGCKILAKAEFLNPGGSVKDRAALGLIKAAEQSGKLKPGGTVVEGTAGNTGIGLAHICNARGYRCLIVIPETQSQEKMDALSMLGAELMPVPAVPYKNPENYVRVSERIAHHMENAIWANQFDNTANADAHYETTGPEIWEQTHHLIDGFICATGTGGTLSGISQYLKKQNNKITIGLADPHGSAIARWFNEGNLEVEGEGSITEGIGNGRITRNLAKAKIDLAVTIDDQSTINMLFHLLYHEGLLVGASSAMNLVATMWLARKMGRNKTIVTILCDSGARYQSRLFNPVWMKEKNLTTPNKEDCFNIKDIPM